MIRKSSFLCGLISFFLAAECQASATSFRLNELLSKLQQTSSELEMRIKTQHRNITPMMCQGRLTLQSGSPITTSDVTSSVLYFTPYKGNRIALYDSLNSQWKFYSFSEVSLDMSSLGLTSDLNHDVFVYDNSGTPALELAAWADDVSRVALDDLVRQDGVLVKGSDHSRRYVGTIRTISTTQTTDSLAQRFVWNFHHRVPRHLQLTEATNSWNRNANAIRETNGLGSNQVAYVMGQDESLVRTRSMLLSLLAVAATANNATSTVGVDSAGTSIPESARGGAAMGNSGSANEYRGQLWSQSAYFHGMGYHYLQWLESRSTGNNTTFYGDAGDARVQSGMYAWLDG